MRLKDSNWHRSKGSLKECEWKQGESARGGKTFLRIKEDEGTPWRLPLVGGGVLQPHPLKEIA